MPYALIASAARTPTGKFGGALASLDAATIGAHAARAAIARSGIAAERVEMCIFGHARQAGNGPNIARHIALRAGCSDTTVGYTINMACGSGLEALLHGAAAILAGADAVLVGGTEHMSSIPYLLPQARFGARMGHAPLVDAMIQDGYMCPMAQQLMGETAETLARELGIPRVEQERYALESQRRALHAIESGAFANEIAPIEIPGKGAPLLVDRDETPRATTLEALAKLKPVFGGVITAGTSSSIADGAAALVLVSERLAVQALARIGVSAHAALDPKRMGLAPVPAVEKLLAKTNRDLKTYDLVELNEAFAAQMLACDRSLHFDRETLNVKGGAIALGHPTGCSGARIAVTLVHALRDRSAKSGIATLCISGGQAIAAEILAV